MSALRAFWLTLFAIGAAGVLVLGWSGGEPWTAAAFVMFFTSRVVRSEIKRRQPLGGSAAGHAHARRFILVTAAGWLGAGALAVAATLAGEGQEWLFVAPLFVVMGALNLYVAFN
jgi:hypothetical protein